MPIEESAEVVEEMPEEESESVSLPLSILGGQTVAPGDVVKLQVVEVDDEGGMISVKYPKPESGGLKRDAMAAKFGE